MSKIFLQDSFKEFCEINKLELNAQQVKIISSLEKFLGTLVSLVPLSLYTEQLFLQCLTPPRIGVQRLPHWLSTSNLILGPTFLCLPPRHDQDLASHITGFRYREYRPPAVRRHNTHLAMNALEASDRS